MRKMLLSISVLLILTSCVQKRIEHLDCIWILPEEMEQTTNTNQYSMVTRLDGISYSAIRFLNNGRKEENTLVHQGAVINKNDNYLYKGLKISESFSLKPPPGLKFYSITRENFSGSVLVTNYDFKKMVESCSKP